MRVATVSKWDSISATMKGHVIFILATREEINFYRMGIANSNFQLDNKCIKTNIPLYHGKTPDKQNIFI